MFRFFVGLHYYNDQCFVRRALCLLFHPSPGLHLRSIEEPPSRMVSEQGGTSGLDHPNSRAPLSAPNHHNQHHHHHHHHQQSTTTSQTTQQYPHHVLQPHQVQHSSNHHHRHNNNNSHSNQSHQLHQQQLNHHQQQPYDPELVRMESWMDENPEFVQDYFIRLVGDSSKI